MIKRWFVYIITNYKNTVFYTGITNDLQRRVYEHKRGFTEKSFACRYRLYKLIWFEEFLTPEEAIGAEKRVKDFSRVKKIILIKRMNPLFKDLMTLH